MERVEGVRSATFSYPEGTGSVTYDTTVTAPTTFLAELERRTGFRAVPVDPRE